MNRPQWLERGMKLLRSKLDQPEKQAAVAVSEDRSTRERIDAFLKHRDEALSSRSLRKMLTQLNDIIDTKVSEIEGGRRAKVFAKWYELSLPEIRLDVWLLMSEYFGPDAKKVMSAREEYTQAFGTQDEGAAEIKLRRSLVSP
ncbi:MAG: malonyl-CoA decarboxylase, partial [Betaproteobacteria bacterium]